MASITDVWGPLGHMGPAPDGPAVRGWACFVSPIFPLGCCDTHFYVNGTVHVVWVQVGDSGRTASRGPSTRTWLRKWNAQTEASAIRSTAASVLQCCQQMFPLDLEKLQEEFHMRGICRPTDSRANHPREDVYNSSLFDVVPLSLHKRMVCLLLSHGRG